MDEEIKSDRRSAGFEDRKKSGRTVEKHEGRESRPKKKKGKKKETIEIEEISGRIEEGEGFLYN